MAPYGSLGYRNVLSVAAEISFHLCQQIVNTTLSTATSTGLQTIPIASTLYLYPGAQLIVDSYQPSQETITIISVSVGSGTITATFLNSHAIGASVLGPTFYLQQATDPLFTQSEILGYIARAQNEFLARVPCYFLLQLQTVLANTIYQSVACDMIEIDRIAASAPNIPIVSLSRSSDLVTAVTSIPHNLSSSPASTFSIINPLDITFAGAFKVASILSPTSFTYPQQGTNASTSEGIVGRLLRLYEVSQEELSMQNGGWAQMSQAALKSWFEDRSGNYMWGVGGNPANNFPVELLLSIRDTDTLELGDGFLQPDITLHFTKYRALQYAWSKDGEQRNPQMATYCEMRFDRGILAVQRYLDNMVTPPLMMNVGRRTSRAS